MDVDAVIIGLNTEATLRECLESVLKTPQTIHLFYVDGGSTDSSLAIARSFPQVRVLEIHTHPTPGLGRNVGWLAGSSPFVQFLDSDTKLDPHWLDKAIEQIQKPGIGAVCGYRRELHPEQSVYNWIGDQEWNDKPGECSAFGGDVLIRRDILQQTGGYNPDLIAGEDPEFSQRILQTGSKIIRLDALMTWHDLRMLTFAQYWRRAMRTGYAYAAVHQLHKDFWKNEVSRIIVRGGGFLLLALIALLYHSWWWLPALFLLFYPRLFKIKAIEDTKGLTLEEARVYAWHCSFVVIPQFLGMCKYYLEMLPKQFLGSFFI